jgi:hypothetical protein
MENGIIPIRKIKKNAITASMKFTIFIFLLINKVLSIAFAGLPSPV